MWFSAPFFYGELAKMVRQKTANLSCEGSTPSFTSKLIIMKQLLFILLLFITSCDTSTTPVKNEQVTETYVQSESESFKKGKRQLAAQGYKNIKESSNYLFCCAEEDSYLLSSGFTAEDADGVKVEGCFCVKGVLRNSVTIRFK